jgi:hypothetical protein
MSSEQLIVLTMRVTINCYLYFFDFAVKLLSMVFGLISLLGAHSRNARTRVKIIELRGVYGVAEY